MDGHSALMGLKLAVFSGQYFSFDGECYSTDEAFVKFVLSFCPYFEKIVFCDAVIRTADREVYTLDPGRTGLCPLPYFGLYSVRQNFLLVYPKIYKTIKRNIQNWDIVWVHAPHPVSLIFAMICKRFRKPFFLFIRQNLPHYVRSRNRGLKRTVSIPVAAGFELIIRLLARNTLTFTVGRELFNAYRRKSKFVYQTLVSLIAEKDICDCVDSEVSDEPTPVRLLSVGRLDREKGLSYLVEAMDELVTHRRRYVRLDFVGTGSEESRLRRQVRERRLSQNINFLGYVAHDDDLFEIYKAAHIFILPSLTEGFPQSLFEAMASATAIVATKVGGIPEVIRHEENGLLINPASPGEICAAVERLIDDPHLRRRVTQNGLRTAERHTMEKERDRMIFRIQQILK